MIMMIMISTYLNHQSNLRSLSIQITKSQNHKFSNKKSKPWLKPGFAYYLITNDKLFFYWLGMYFNCVNLT
jgi:hypothetical protein